MWWPSEISFALRRWWEIRGVWRLGFWIWGINKFMWQSWLLVVVACCCCLLCCSSLEFHLPCVGSEPWGIRGVWRLGFWIWGINKFMWQSWWESKLDVRVRSCPNWILVPKSEPKSKSHNPLMGYETLILETLDFCMVHLRPRGVPAEILVFQNQSLITH